MMEGSLQKQLDETEILEEMPFTEWLKMFSANHSAVIGLVILIFVISLSLIGPLFYKTDPFEMVWAPFSPPGEEGFYLERIIWVGTFLLRSFMAEEPLLLLVVPPRY